jgi:hypothetical protein
MLLWSLARASAFVAFGAYTLVVAWGILLAGKRFRPAAPQVHFHRFLAMLGLLAVFTHIGALLADQYSKVHPAMLAGIGARPAMLPGVLALWLLVLLPLSFRLRKAKWISQRVWRGFHYTAHLAWVAMLLHGVFNGTDSRSPYAIGLYGAGAAIVAAALTLRAPDRATAARRGVQARTAPARRS